MKRRQKQHLLKAIGMAGILAVALMLSLADLGDLGIRAAGSALGRAVQAEQVPDVSRHRIVSTLPRGNELGQVGIDLDGSPPRGPEALAIGPDGTINVLDTWNGRVIVLDGNGTVRSEIPFSGVHGLDVGFTEAGGMLILGVYEVLEVDREGTAVRHVPLNREIAPSITGLAVTQGNDIALETEGANRLLVTERAAPVSPSAQASERYRVSGLAARGADLQFTTRYSSTAPSSRPAVIEAVAPSGAVQSLPVQVQNGVGHAKVLGVDVHGSIYVLVTELFPGPTVQIDLTVRRYAADGTPNGMARVPVAGQMALARHNTAVDREGRVFSLVTLADQVQVVELTFADQLAPSYSGSTLLRLKLAASLNSLQARVAEAANRTTANQMANDYVWATWIATSANLGACPGATLPTWIGGPGEKTSIPYQHGGSSSITGFRNGVGATPPNKPGDINTSPGHDYQFCARGVDCSGYIQVCWGLPADDPWQKKDDTMLKDGYCTGQVDWDDMYVADMWRLPGSHVRLHKGYDIPHTGAYVYESTTANGGRVWSTFYNWSQLYGYEPWRWRGY